MNLLTASARRSSFVAAAVAVASLFAAAPALAQSAAPALTQLTQLTQVAAGSFRVRLANPGQQRVAVQVTQSSNGQVIFAQSSTAPAYGHRLDFGTLPAGSYALTLQVGDARTRYNILVSNAPNGAVSAVCQPVAPAAGAALVAAGF